MAVATLILLLPYLSLSIPRLLGPSLDPSSLLWEAHLFFLQNAELCASTTYSSGLRGYTSYSPHLRRSLPNMHHMSSEPPKIYPAHLLFVSNYRLPNDVDRCHLEVGLDVSCFIRIFFLVLMFLFIFLSFFLGYTYCILLRFVCLLLNYYLVSNEDLKEFQRIQAGKLHKFKFRKYNTFRSFNCLILMLLPLFFSFSATCQTPNLKWYSTCHAWTSTAFRNGGEMTSRGDASFSKEILMLYNIYFIVILHSTRFLLWGKPYQPLGFVLAQSFTSFFFFLRSVNSCP